MATDEGVARLADRLADDYAVEHWGYAQFADLEDLEQRAVVSDQLLGTTDAIGANLRDARGHLHQVVELHGPNGRAMPDPARPSEEAEMHALDREIAALFRATGSVLDCLAGVAIAVLRLPESIQRADANMLWRLESLSTAADAPSVWNDFAQIVERQRDDPDRGWLEWTLETRNAFVHRARLMRTWLPRGGRRPGDPQVLVRSELPIHRLIRYDLHLRRSPWHPDMRALSAASPAGDNWLGEPATATVSQIVSRVGDLANASCAQLASVWSDAATGTLRLRAPSKDWALEEPRPVWRVDAARRFNGFSSSTIPLTSLVMSPRDAKRAELAEAVRQRRLC